MSESTLDAWTRGDLEVPGDFAELIDTGLVDAVDPDAPLTDHTALESTEGHTPGHVVLRVDTGAAELVLAGHLFIFPNQVSDPTIANDSNPALAAAQRRDLLDDLGESGGILFAQLLGGCGGGTVVADDVDRHRLVPLPAVRS
jgi:glyoxylase-like metal-dependent hydrolase (beta-lactamase superfamily II)